MKKRYLIPLVLLLVVAVAFVAAGFWLDDITAAAMEYAGKTTMGVTTTVHDAALHPIAGSLTVQGLTVGNPERFHTPHFLAIGSVACAFSLGNLLEDDVVLPQLAIEGVDINLEQNERGANYQVILDHMKKSEQEPPPAEQASDKKFVIREVVLKEIVAHTDVALAGQKLTKVDVKIPEIRLQDVGSGTDGGMLQSQLLATIVKATLEAIITSGHEILPQAVVAGLGIGLKEVGGLVDVDAIKVVEAAGVNLSEIGGKAVEGAVEGVEKGVKEAVEGLGGLLGGKKEKKEEKK